MALSAAIVWEVRNGGSDTNGGGFKSGASGTDWTQQDAAQYSVTDGVTAGTTTITSATANFGTDVVGNVMYVQGGTGSVTAGWYEITARTNSTTITVDRSTGLTAGTGVTLKIGGALATVVQAANTCMAGSNTCYVKYNATAFSSSSSVTPPAGSTYAPTRLIGYNATRGDLDSVATFTNYPTLKISSGSNHVIATTNEALDIRNFILDANNLGDSCVNGGGNYLRVSNCKATGFVSYGFYLANWGATAFRCWATTGKAGSAYGFRLINVHQVAIGCIASSCVNHGFYTDYQATFIRCIASNNTGASTDGFNLNDKGSLIGCIAYKNGRDGVRFANDRMLSVYNCILCQNSGYGLKASAVTYTVNVGINYNAYYSNTSGAVSNLVSGPNDVTLTGDPFTNAASDDYSLNNTSGAGAACRAAGYPGALPGAATTGYLDIGAAQHQDAGGAAGIMVHPGMTGGMRG